MYGLVNKAVEDLVCSHFGNQAWERILDKAGIGVDMFVSMDDYPDSVTYKLVAAACEVLDMEPSQVLRAFGEYWTRYTVQEGYGEMIAMFGDTFKDFLCNLDTMHSHIAVAFPNLRPPHFEVEEIEGGKSLLLHYHSDREGLAPMVSGLLSGLAKRFNESVEITQTAHRGVAEHDIFRIDYIPA
jgi:hypothetical protein